MILKTKTLDINVSDAPAPWNLTLTPVTDDDGITCAHLHLEAPQELPPPQLSITLSMPMTDIHAFWSPRCRETFNVIPDWAGGFSSHIAANGPYFSLISQSEENRLGVAVSEALRTVILKCGVNEERTVVNMELALFTVPEAPIQTYDMDIRLDCRCIFYADAIRQMSAWFENFPETRPCIPPHTAFEPIYSSWYSYHQNMKDAAIEDECRLAKAFGFNGIIIDDGWQTDDNSRGYAYCGEWNPTPSKFPDMKAHVARVHALGMRYILWYSVPFVGFETDAFKKFQGKYLSFREGLKAAVLDPRFPDVREYLINIYENAVKDWDLDGFKLDFIDCFSLPSPDPAIADNYTGRDIKSLPAAVDALLSETIRRLRALKPDILIEFRQSYIGPAIRKYGNMFRAGDCPADVICNRIRTLCLRLSSGGTAVHSDMLEWHPEETPECAAHQLLNVIFSVPQISVRLAAIPETHQKMLRFWLDFCRNHEQTLLHSPLYPHFLEFNFPIVEAAGEDESIIAVYEQDTVVKTPARRVFIVNATKAEQLVCDIPKQPRAIQTYDCQGNAVANALPAPGLHYISVPPSGLLMLTF